MQRTVLHLGEINGSQEAAWRQTLEVFDEGRQEHRTLSLFPDDTVAIPASVDSLRVRLSELELHRARGFGDCWLGCETVAAAGAKRSSGTSDWMKRSGVRRWTGRRFWRLLSDQSAD